MEVLFDPIFRLPFLTGLMLSISLAVIGVLLRLRDEWLAALGLAHLAGASALLGLAAGIPAVLGAPLGALAGALIKHVGRIRGNSIFAAMILFGWCLTLLVAANSTLGSALGDALIEGQLYFAGVIQTVAAGLVLLLVVSTLPVLAPRLVRSRFFPGFEKANPVNAWRWHLGFDVLAALVIAVGVGSVGLMAAFALVFVPPWLAFRVAGSWRQAIVLSLASGAGVYIMAFTAALLLDQPFAPVLVLLLLLLMPFGLFAGNTTGGRAT